MKSCENCNVLNTTGCSSYTAEDCGLNHNLWEPKKKSKVRLIVTLDCHKDCPYCCNKYQKFKDMMHPIKYSELKTYDEIIITGGEPLLSKHIHKTLGLIFKIRNNFPEKTIYLYTTKWKFDPTHSIILENVDGVHFTLHAPVQSEDLRALEAFQRMLKYANKKKGSYRLYVDPDIDKEIAFFPNLFKRVESKPWLLEHEVPFNEDALCILEDF